MSEAKDAIIGYSGFDILEQCYGYNEDACYVADTEASADDFMRGAAFTEEEYTIEAVTLSRIMDDYGSSLGEFAMEKEALARFRAAASDGVEFKTRSIDGLPELTLLNVKGTRADDA